jgi:DNA adenine methylase
MHAAGTAPRSPVRPFLKWAGGKRQLLRELRRFIPPQFGAYYEPFLGSGAVFFEMCRTGTLAGRPCRLTDINRDLVGCYNAVARDVDAVIGELRQLARRHERGGAAEYYRLRNDVFNPRRRQLRTAGTSYPADLAALFIYLNRTGYNGLFRLNSRGDFNVPAGRYVNPRICDEDTLRAAAAALRQPDVAVAEAPFSWLEEVARPGDFVYFDPPYVPLTATARFTSYTRGTFSDGDQRALQRTVLALAERGCAVVVSNSTAPLVAELYDARPARRAGLRAWRVAARRAINSAAGGRGPIDEYVISNVPPASPS